MMLIESYYWKKKYSKIYNTLTYYQIQNTKQTEILHFFCVFSSPNERSDDNLQVHTLKNQVATQEPILFWYQIIDV